MVRCKADKKFKPEQPFGCEDLNYRSPTKQMAVLGNYAIIIGIIIPQSFSLSASFSPG